MNEMWIGGPYTDNGYCPNKMLTSGCVRGCIHGCQLSPAEREAAMDKTRLSLRHEKWVAQMRTRSLKQDFLTVIKPWCDKVEYIKDLKPVRRAPYTITLNALKEEVEIFSNEAIIFGRLERKLPELRNEIVNSPIGGKATREDIWRRLLWVEITMGMHEDDGLKDQTGFTPGDDLQA